MIEKEMSHDKIGVLLVNLGTPDSPDYFSVRRYLKEFLSDRRVIEENPLLWKIILYGVILPFRSGRSAKAYQKVWRSDKNESPLRYYTREKARLVLKAMQGQKNVIISWAMRYGNPSIEQEILKLQNQGCQRLAIIPLYPQYAACTTATVNDEVFRCLMKMRWQPAIRTADAYHDDPLYIKALRNSILQHLKTLSWVPEKILASFHGLPKEYFEKGDPYACFCYKTARLLNESLPKGLPKVEVTFQSRVGRKKWLEPYTDQVIEKLAKEGVKSLAIITPGFASECLETLEEIQMEGRDIFQENGGQNFTQVPCLNECTDHIKLIKNMIERTTQGWGDA